MRYYLQPHIAEWEKALALTISPAERQMVLSHAGTCACA